MAAITYSFLEKWSAVLYSPGTAVISWCDKMQVFRVQVPCHTWFGLNHQWTISIIQLSVSFLVQILSCWRWERRGGSIIKERAKKRNEKEKNGKPVSHNLGKMVMRLQIDTQGFQWAKSILVFNNKCVSLWLSWVNRMFLSSVFGLASQ